MSTYTDIITCINWIIITAMLLSVGAMILCL